MQEIVNHLKQTGFVYQGSDIYGGLSNTWDYGPLGVLLTKNIKDTWWREFITKEENNFGIDAKILMNPKVWVASGHVGNFSDPLVENKTNGKRYRADKIIEEHNPEINAEIMSKEDMQNYLNEHIKKYDNAKTEWTEIREFHLMFETQQGVVVDKKSTIFLRPETAQGIFVNFANVQRSQRAKIPFGIGQIGKSFRNEVTPGNFIFRTREFEQMELEYFVKPGEDDLAYKYYTQKAMNFILNLGIKKENVKFRVHDSEELAHYSKGTTDVEYNFPFGWGELLGVSNRTDFDLKAHASHSGEKLHYRDPQTNEVYTPYVIEPSFGMDRLVLTIICDAFEKEKLENEERIVLKINKNLVPYKVAILPLTKKISKEAREIFLSLIDKGISTTFDEAGSIGKRYRRQDAIGTPYAITFDYDSLEDKQVTIRDRDTMEQKRVPISELSKYIK
ncbi:glycine--tRNA ligase [Mycoplasma marinum]|uniref:Glycine--tRNA ligase n=2 Tax=Mycoplasma marinum TaxID=1937190 RepID=A0A4R0XV10_9MOLU|nr:glycine--tRNA ligase [Mycoplasma marinum]TCG10741.1 glycine--tRNA ligase [Mycoplasma marinum]